MKRYIIILNNGLRTGPQQEIEAENEGQLLEKIDTGIYEIIPIWAKYGTTITRENIKEIIEVKK